MYQQLFKSVITAAAMLALTACSEAPGPIATTPPAEAEKKAPEVSGPVAAQTAFFEMYKPARTWANDLLPLSLSSGEIPNVKNEGGKAATWTAVFVSPSRREARTFTYSIADSGSTIRKGVSAGGSQLWSGATPVSRPFQVTQFTVNSDAAYEVAYKKAAAWVKKHPDKKPAFYLVSSARYPQPVWYVLWGNKTLGFGVYINAVTGNDVTGK